MTRSTNNHKQDQPEQIMHARWYHGWNIVAVCILSQVAALGIPTNCFSFFLKPWSDEFGLPISTLTLAITLFSMVCVGAAAIAGFVCERFPIRNVMCIAMLGIVAGHVLIGSAHSGWQIILLYMLFLPIPIVFSTGIPAQILVTRWFVKKRGVALALSAFGVALAGVIFPPIVVVLLKYWSWRVTWYVFAAAILVLVTTTLFFVVRDRHERDGRDYVPFDPPATSSRKLAVKEIFSRRNFWLTLGVYVPLQLAYSAVNATFAPFAGERGMTSEAIAMLVGVFNIAALCGKLATGLLTDRFGNRLPLILVAACSLAGMLCLIFFNASAGTAAGFILVGLSQSMLVLQASCIAAEFGASDFARAYGLLCALGPIGTLSPPIFALMRETSGSYTSGLVSLAVLCLVALFIALSYRDSAATPATEDGQTSPV